MRVAIAYPAFVSAFKEAYPELVLFNPSKHSVKDFQLIIFPGGEDINPSIYGENNTFSSYNEDRDRTELNILEKCFYNHVKILGVCRGHQLVAAFNGTRLIQDIFYYTKKRHEGEHYLEYFTDKSLIRYALNGEHVNSMHHQGFSPSNSKLTVTSMYNGIAESVESEYTLTVQFHPEFFDVEKKKNFFDVVNKWVDNRESLISEITKFFKSKSRKEVAEKKSEYEEHMRRVQEMRNEMREERIRTGPQIDVSRNTTTITGTLEDLNSATTFNTNNIRLTWQPTPWGNNTTPVENPDEEIFSEELLDEDIPN